MTTTHREQRRAILQQFGAGEPATEELLAYLENHFTVPAAGTIPIPLADERCVAAWEEYVQACDREGGGAAVLRRRLPQLAFPIAEGMSQDAGYRRATREGRWEPEADEGLEFERPESVTLRLHATPAGRIAVITCHHRADFVALLRALTRRNEPEVIPESMGACMVGGFANWNRIRVLRNAWAATAVDPSETGWRQAWPALSHRKEEYQDRFILLSDGPYSGVRAEVIGVDADTWRDWSLCLRLEHECAHYFTRRVFGSMRNTLLDELIADFAGITAVVPTFQARWYLAFLGLERYPAYREGGRLQNYRGTPPLSDDAFSVLQALVVAAAGRVERFDQRCAAEEGEPLPAPAWRNTGADALHATSTHERSPARRAAAMAAIASWSLEEIAADGGEARLRETYRQWLPVARAAESSSGSIR